MADIISSSFKELFNQQIDELLKSTACTVPCRLIYPESKWVDCTNCENGLYVSGGPQPFAYGQICPMCSGQNKIRGTEQTESLDLIVIFNRREIFNSGGWLWDNSIKEPERFAQTFSHQNVHSKLRKCKEIILDSDNEVAMRNRYVRHGEPELCGFGSNDYIICLWEKSSS